MLSFALIPGRCFNDWAPTPDVVICRHLSRVRTGVPPCPTPPVCRLGHPLDPFIPLQKRPVFLSGLPHANVVICGHTNGISALGTSYQKAVPNPDILDGASVTVHPQLYSRH